MSRQSAGLLLYHFTSAHVIEVLLVHPGGPFWKNKDAGAWSIPKGEYTEGENPEMVALREFEEETGNPVEGYNLQLLGAATLKSGKIITAYIMEGYLPIPYISSNTFSMEWPPKSGRQQLFPEVDKAAWFTIAEALEKINKGQITLLAQLQVLLANKHEPNEGK